eukprot:13913554-Heterocapsa_arctica.AAC.1
MEKYIFPVKGVWKVGEQLHLIPRGDGMRLLPGAVTPTPVHPDTWESWSHCSTAATLRTLWRICHDS